MRSDELDRRDFLRTLGSGALGAFGLACASGNSSTQTSGKLDRIGLQLYTVRTEMEKDFDGTLARVAEIGFTEVEFAGYYNRSPAEVRATIERHGLRAPSAHVGSASAVTGDWERTVANAKSIGHDYLVVAYLTQEERRTLDDYRKLADIFNQAGETTQKMGIQFAYHNHDFEFVPMEDQIPYDVLLSRTNPALVRMEMDLFWITKAGKSPLAYFERHPGRFHMVHVKDMRRDGAMVDVGAGAIDFKSIFAERAKAGIRHFFVEHDEPKPSALESVRASYQYLSRLEF